MTETGVILVEYHSAGLVEARAAEALRRGDRVVVTDNSGTYAGAGAVVGEGANIGFGAGCNLAVAALPPEVDVVVLMNPDLVIGDADLSALVGAVRSGACDVVAPSTATPRGLRTGFRRPSPWREPAVALREARWERRDTPEPHEPPAAATAGETELEPARATQFGSGSLVVVRRSAYDAVGGFDESYFLYAEDADLWDRLVASGAVAAFAHGVVARHESSTGSPASAARRHVLRRLGVEHYLADRGRPVRHLRALHRLLLPRDELSTDDVIATVADGYRRGLTAKEISTTVRERALSPATG